MVECLVKSSVPSTQVPMLGSSQIPRAPAPGGLTASSDLHEYQANM